MTDLHGLLLTLGYTVGALVLWLVVGFFTLALAAWMSDDIEFNRLGPSQVFAVVLMWPVFLFALTCLCTYDFIIATRKPPRPDATPTRDDNHQ